MRASLRVKELFSSKTHVWERLEEVTSIGQIGHQSAVVMTPEQRAVYLRVSTCFGGSFI